MKCKAKTKAGKGCKNDAVSGARYCWLHCTKQHGTEGDECPLLFTGALYYPFIEIPSEQWLKTAALYWNSISTIVPRSIKPYRFGAAKKLSDAGVLQAISVSPDMPEVSEIADDVVSYLRTEEGIRMLLMGHISDLRMIHNQKMARRVLREMYREARIHEDKFGAQLLHDIERSIGRKGRDPWVRVPGAFGAYYMTLLASRIARSKGLALLTDEPSVESLANKVSLGAAVPIRPDIRVPARLAEGLLATMALRTIRLAPTTSIRKILQFRERYESELGKFRSSIRELVQGLSGSVEPQPLSQHVLTLYKDKISPAIEDLRGRLRDHRITCGFANLRLSALASVSPTVVGSVLSQAGYGPFAVFAGVALSVVLHTASYRVQRKRILRGNPYSFILTAEKTFGRKRRPT